MTEEALSLSAPILPLPRVDEVIEVILKLPGESCNLNCSYCYEKRQPRPSDGVLGPDEIRQLAVALKGHKVSIGLHGGEPLLLGKNLMRGMLTAIGEHLDVTDVKLQTNGTLLDDEWIRVFSESPLPITIGVSHDGPCELSRYRVNYSTSNMAAKSQRALECFVTRKFRSE